MTRRGPDTGPSGICVVDKPAGWTSHDVVARARRELGTRKVGHAGTLDPMATGVLVLGVGRGTRLLTFITGVAKTYEATIRFGVETASLDADGEVTATHDMSGLDPAAVRAGAAELTGDLLQVPPMVSALKVDGRRLHELAREGVEVERRPRPVSVTRFDVAPTPDPLVWTARSSAPRAPTCAPWPPTWVGRSAGARTWPACAAPQWGRSCWTRPTSWTTWRCCRSRRVCATSTRWWPMTTSLRRSATVVCSRRGSWGSRHRCSPMPGRGACSTATGPAGGVPTAGRAPGQAGDRARRRCWLGCRTCRS